MRTTADLRPGDVVPLNDGRNPATIESIEPDENPEFLRIRFRDYEPSVGDAFIVAKDQECAWETV